MKRLEEQFLLINRAMKSPADGVDCIEGGVWIINQKISTLSAGSYTVGARVTNKRDFNHGIYHTQRIGNAPL